MPQVTYARADTRFVAIPLVRSRQNHLMVRAFINGKEAWLTIDSGAPVSAIAVNRRNHFRLKPISAKSNLPARIQINGAFNNVAIARELRLGGLTLIDETPGRSAWISCRGREDDGASGLRRVLAGPGARQTGGRAPVAGAHHVDSGPVGPGGHVGRDSLLPGAEGRRAQADHNYLVMGPWRHSQVNYDGYNLGPLKWDGDTAAAVPPRRAEAVLRPVPEGRRAQGRHAAGVHLQHRREPLGPPEELAAGLREGLRRAAEAALSAGRISAWASTSPGAARAADAYVSDPAKPVPYVPRPVRFADSRPLETWLVTDQRIGGRPHRRADLPDARADRAGADQRRARRRPVRGDHRHGRRLGGEADRRLSRRGARASPRWAAISWPISMDIFRGRYRESFEHPTAIPAGTAAALPLRAADREPRVPAGPPHHGADPVELVPALRPQPADLRAEHLLRQAGGLREGDANRCSAPAEQASAVWLPVVQ